MRERRLGFGQFFGSPAFRRDLPGFALARASATRPPAEVPDHVHDTAHFVLVLSGRYLTTAAPFEPGRDPCLVYNPPATVHADRFASNHGEFFTVSVADRALEALGVRDLPDRPLAMASGPALRLARRLLRVGGSWPPRSRSRAEAACRELVWAMARGGAANRPRVPRWLSAARRTLEERSAERVRLRDLADAARVHPVHLIRSFQRFYGVTPRRYLGDRRLAHAERLLADPSLPLAEIAARAGFADQSHLTRVFTRRHGRPPGAWRRNRG